MVETTRLCIKGAVRWIRSSARGEGVGTGTCICTRMGRGGELVIRHEAKGWASRNSVLEHKGARGWGSRNRVLEHKGGEGVGS